MKHKRAKFSLVIAAILLSIYLSEFLLGFMLVKSLPLHPLPSDSVQTHKMPEYNVTYRNNNYSLRGEDIDFSKQYDVALFGDSFFFGLGVEFDGTIAEQLKHKHGLSVLNASESATNPKQFLHKFKILRSYELKSAHYVISIFFTNDFQGISNANLDSFLDTDYSDDPLAYGALSFLKLDRLRYLLSAFYHKSRGDFFAHRFQIRKTFHEDWIIWYTNNNPEAIDKMFHNEYKPISSEDDYLQATQITDESIDKTARIVNAFFSEINDGSSLHVVLIPDRHFVVGELSARHETSKGRFMGKLDQRIEILDLHGKLSPEMYFENDGHWNHLGHQRSAKLLSDHLARQ